MRFLYTIIAAVSLFVAGTAAANTQFCTQDQKQLANKLHEQNEDPAKSCYRTANGDITTLTTTRLCPLPECVAWLEYMAANAPDCYYDSTNYATAYAAKSAACTGGSSESASGSSSGSLSLSLSSSGSETSADLLNKTSSGSLETMSEDRDLNTTDSRNGSSDSSTVGSMASVGGNVGSSSSDLEIDTTAAPTPTPTEDLTIEDSPSAGASDSSNSSTPTPTTNAAASLDSIHSLVAVLFIAAAAIVIEQ